LLRHMDVVPATASEWDTDPLTAVTQDSYIFGCGAFRRIDPTFMH
jgi:acetylornithine deacetylase/succinyl-diaminopimelate desuccinylase-like protein